MIAVIIWQYGCSGGCGGNFGGSGAMVVVVVTV